MCSIEEKYEKQQKKNKKHQNQQPTSEGDRGK